MPNLFSPLIAGDLSLANRIVMAPLTRTRARADGVPTDVMVEHYAQRASVGLIVSEGTFPSAAGKGFEGQPGLVTADQVAGWRAVTDAVHDEGGLIVAQVMHAGRVTHSDISGLPVEAPSALAVDGETRAGGRKVRYPVPRALGIDELPRIVDDFVRGAQNAIDAGFDGVELHAANGYLLHEFLGATSNTRTDAYGGSPENRIRFVVEVVEAVVAQIGAGRVGIRISPERNIQGLVEDDPEDVESVYGALMDALAPLDLAFVSVLHPEPWGSMVQGLRSRFGGPFLVNTGFAEATTRDDAVGMMADAVGDAVVVGRAIIANPDLVRRWKDELEQNELDLSTIYADGAVGYTDYPTYGAARELDNLRS
ncbi:alkene reductase [Microbacterium oryzae]|uniref:alkene reductase n=1 Tax=Microbacterium oryzae TaxID=743009 RepID=UPI0025AF9119|nr:alkene reductase [Microbacterium oryzae]MDN3309729.1 alkene reductase [Microbacterium oryzae]